MTDDSRRLPIRKERLISATQRYYNSNQEIDLLYDQYAEVYTKNPGHQGILCRIATNNLGPRTIIYALQWRYWGILIRNLGIWVRSRESFGVLSQKVTYLGGTYSVQGLGPGLLVQTERNCERQQSMEGFSKTLH